MGKVLHTEDLLTRLAAAEKRIAALERGRPLANASVSQGNFDVRTPQGDVIMKAGELQIGSETAYGVELRRGDGSLQARFFDTPGGNGYWALFDEASNVVVSNDTVAGVGLATPYIPYTVMLYSEMSTPPIPTTSATFVATHRIHGQKQHPKLRVQLLTDSDAATTGEVILMQGGVQIGGTLEVPAADNSYRWIDAPVDGDHLSFVYVDLQVRRTGGAGNVRVAPAWAAGIQS